MNRGSRGGGFAGGVGGADLGLAVGGDEGGEVEADRFIAGCLLDRKYTQKLRKHTNNLRKAVKNAYGKGTKNSTIATEMPMGRVPKTVRNIQKCIWEGYRKYYKIYKNAYGRGSKRIGNSYFFTCFLRVGYEHDHKT